MLKNPFVLAVHLLEKKTGRFLLPCERSFESDQTTKANSAVLGILSKQYLWLLEGWDTMPALKCEDLLFIVIAGNSRCDRLVFSLSLSQFHLYGNVATEWWNGLKVKAHKILHRYWSCACCVLLGAQLVLQLTCWLCCSFYEQKLVGGHFFTVVLLFSWLD